MFFKAFCILVIILVVAGMAVAPLKSNEQRVPNPAPPKRKDMTQDDYAKQVLKGMTITKFYPEDLPIPNPKAPKYVITDDPQSIEELLTKDKFVKKFEETSIPRIEQSTAYRLTVQNHWNDKLLCLQRVRVYEEVDKLEDWLPIFHQARDKFDEEQQKLTPEERKTKKFRAPRRKFKETPREDLLVRCEGGYSLTMRTSKYRFGFADALHFYGKNRLIYKLQDNKGGKGYFCHERMYTVVGRKDKYRTAKKCDMIINRIYSFQGSIRNLLFNLDPTNMLSGLGSY